MSETNQGSSFSWRALTSMLTTGGFLVMGFTGLMLYITPEGRVANWVDWSVLGLTKTQWGDIHVTSSLIFLVAGFVHLYFNWRQFVSYLRRRFEKGLALRWEGPIALVLMAVLVAGTLERAQPFTYVLELSASIKDSWKSDPSMDPPFGHAEEVTIQTLALRTATTTSDLVAAIRDAGYKIDGPQQTLRAVADQNGVSPVTVWNGIVKRVPAVVPTPIDTATDKVWTAEEVATAFEGKGFGGKTIEQAATETGRSVDDLVAKLAAAGIKASSGDRLRALADGAGTTPTELLKVMLVPDYKLAGK